MVVTNFYLCRQTAIGWPRKIVTQIEAVVAQHVQDEERFHKIHLVNTSTFQDQIESLQVSSAVLVIS